MSKQKFQSTQPSQAVTKETSLPRKSMRFQSTQPSQAVTHLSIQSLVSLKFQSTQPSQAVTNIKSIVEFYYNISIHTALAGCDWVYLSQDTLL